MQKMVRLGDTSNHGGIMITASATFTINGRIGCLHGDLHECPIKDHNITRVVSTSTVKNQNRSILRTGDVAGCGAVLITGSPNTSTN